VRADTGRGPANSTTPPAPSASPPAPSTSPPATAVGEFPKTDYLLDLSTGEMTPLPVSIAGTKDRIYDYAASPDGSKLAYAGPGENGASQVFIANLDGSGAEQVTTDDEAMAPAWSPDGSKIAYLGQRGNEPQNIFVLDLATGASTQVTFETDGVFDGSPPSFTPDGASIVYGGQPEGEVKIVQIAGRESAHLADLTREAHVDDFLTRELYVEDFADNVQLSPDGALLAYSCPGGLISVCVANADGTDARYVAKAGDSVVSPRWSPDGTRLAYWSFHAAEVFVVDVATGKAVQVTHGAQPAWLDDHTLIVKPDRCVGPLTDGCGG